ncbi:MAG TPA: trypsin-like peptidase domain-containing protein, partial [Candidatus Polarisedimenticolaceae bacterium]|nr:trypsin-like peptidase domain-containing protein [Candidatus Polarisedimenticolaceae bacterium]
LYLQACAACHGAGGGGDGRAAASLDPRPTSFRDPSMKLVRPRQVRAAIAFGVEGTAMPGFAGAFSDEQSWDLAFYVMTLRADFDPQPPEPPLALSLGDLASSSEEELLARVHPARPDLRGSAIDWYRLHPPAPPAAEIADALRLEETFGRIAARVFPSVVGLSFYVRETATPEKPREGWSGAAPAEPLYPGYRLLRTGNGFFVSEDGYLLTCQHLLAGAELIDVETSSNYHARARVIGVEPTVDLAVLKMEGPLRVPPATLGDDTTVRVGHWVIALADPPGVERSFAPGTVAARPERDCYQEQRSTTLVQTSLRSGAESWGGPLVDIRGEVIALSVPRVPDDPAVFGLPIHLALTLYEALKVKESQHSPWLGISVLELTWKLRQTLRSAPLTGIYIDNVFAPSPAAGAGIRAGDILTEIDGHRILAVADFQKWLYLSGIGTTVELGIYRDGELSSPRVTIEERPAQARPR